MRAELFVDGKSETIALPANAFFVNCRASFPGGSTVNALNDEGLATAEAALGCRAVPIGEGGLPAGITLHALVDPSGELSRLIGSRFPGLETTRVEVGDCRLTVTV